MNKAIKFFTILILLTPLSSFAEKNYSAPLNFILSDKHKNKSLRSTSVFEPKIVGGFPAPEQLYPWQVSIHYKAYGPLKGHFCGGSVIAKRWILTAAHCLDRDTTADILGVYMGANSLMGMGTVISVKKIFTHKDYDPLTNNNDIALLELNNDASVTPVKIITPSQSELNAPGVLSTVTGWGNTYESGRTTPTLMEVGVKIISNRECNSPLSYAGNITSKMLCAGFRQGGKDACQGDSGGPLVVPNRKGGYILAGIVSWGDGCARPGKYGVYTRITEFTNWIQSRTS